MRYHGSRYFDGYERAPSGKLVYTGPRYGYSSPQHHKHMKLYTTAITLVMLIAEILAQFFPSSGGMQRYMAIPSLLSLVPLIFWIMGQGEFLMAKHACELRVYYSGYRRLYRSGMIALVVCIFWLLGEIWYLLQHPAAFTGELLYLLNVALCVGCCAVLVLLLHRNPPQVVEGPVIR